MANSPSQTPAADAPRPGSAGDSSDTSPAFNPIVDVPGLPRVLLIGDSISVGYTVGVQERLAGKANVHRIPENGGPTTRGVENIERWLGEGKWDLIHFNWGLHDIIVMEDGQHQTSKVDYEANLRSLVSRLKETGATLVWRNTTPVPTGNLSPRRRSADVIAINDVAKSIMEKEGIRIQDLHAFALPRLDQLQMKENVHFTEAGSAVLAEEVAACIDAVLTEGR